MKSSSTAIGCVCLNRIRFAVDSESAIWSMCYGDKRFADQPIGLIWVVKWDRSH